MSVSIVMSVYNESSQVLKQAVESIINQSHQDFEFIIILDDPKNNEARELLLEYCQSDSRISLYENEHNLGLALSLNKGINLSKNELIARMDADDISVVDRLEKQVNHMNTHPHVDLISGKMVYVDEEDNEVIIGTEDYSQDVVNRLLPYFNPFNHPTWMFRKKVFKVLGGYRNFPTAQDYDFILRAKTHDFNLQLTDDVILKYRLRDNSISASKSILQQVLVVYIQKLYLERKKRGEDTFTQSYLNKIHYSDDYVRFEEALVMNEKHMKISDGKGLRARVVLLKSMLHSKVQLKAYYNIFMVKKILKFDQEN